MFIVVAPPINIEHTVTQIKHDVFFDCSMTSTCFKNAYNLTPEDFIDFDLKKNNIISTDLKLEELEEQSNSTWNENNLSEFDVIAIVDFNKVIRVKSKIKTVTRYKPNIVF